MKEIFWSTNSYRKVNFCKGKQYFCLFLNNIVSLLKINKKKT
nr:MAG TPA: hypothetical protein [Caudoviricetes sp.]